MTDDLSDRLRRLVDRAQPVDLDEVTHRHPVRARHPVRLAVAGLAVLAAIAGAVALLRVDRAEDGAPVATTPSTVPGTVPTTTVPTTTSPPTTVAPASGPATFVGVTTEGRLVVVDVATGQEVRELARLGDPRTPATADDPIPPNSIESVEVIRATDEVDFRVDQVLYGTCCEPAAGEIFAIGIDGSPTTIPPFEAPQDNGRLFFGHHPAVDDQGTALVASFADGAVSSVTLDDDYASGASQYDLDAQGSATDPSWVRGGAWQIAYEVLGETRTIHLAAGPVAGDIRELTPPDGRIWVDPVGIDGRLVVAEQCCTDEQLQDAATGRVIDTATGEVVDSFAYSGPVGDQDVSATDDLIVTYADGRVVSLDPETGVERALASGFIAASW